jgi:hypothetical protein
MCVLVVISMNLFEQETIGFLCMKKIVQQNLEDRNKITFTRFPECVFFFMNGRWLLVFFKVSR